MKRVYLIVLLILTFISGFSQKITIPLSSFNKLDVFGPFDVKLVKSDKERVEIDFNGIDKKDLFYESRQETFKLKFKNSHYMNEWKNDNRKSRYALVTVYYKDIDVIEAGGGSVVTSDETLKSKYLNIECAMGAEVTLDVISEKIVVAATMGGVLEMSGRTQHLEVHANMGGELKAAHLESKTVFVEANMGAEVMVNGTEEIEASAGFGANVEYVGGPAVRKSSRNFGGEVNKRGN